MWFERSDFVGEGLLCRLLPSGKWFHVVWWKCITVVWAHSASMCRQKFLSDCMALH